MESTVIFNRKGESIFMELGGGFRLVESLNGELRPQIQMSPAEAVNVMGVLCDMVKHATGAE